MSNALAEPPVADQLITESQLETRWGLSRGKIAKDRCLGRPGPRFIRLSPKAIRYRMADVLKFENDKSVTPGAVAKLGRRS